MTPAQKAADAGPGGTSWRASCSCGWSGWSSTREGAGLLGEHHESDPGQHVVKVEPLADVVNSPSGAWALHVTGLSVLVVVQCGADVATEAPALHLAVVVPSRTSPDRALTAGLWTRRAEWQWRSWGALCPVEPGTGVPA